MACSSCGSTSAQEAFSKWENNHDGYGSFVDLESAKLDDVRAFHRDYYGPNNAVLSPSRVTSPRNEGVSHSPKSISPPSNQASDTGRSTDVSEPLNTKEKRVTQSDPLAQVPAVRRRAGRLPERGSADQAPFAVLAEVLAGGDASRMYLGLVKGKEMALNIDFLFGLTGPFEFDGPTLLTLFALYKPNIQSEQLISEMDTLIAAIVKDGVSDAELARVKTGMLANWNNGLESFLSRADTARQVRSAVGRCQGRQQGAGLDRSRHFRRPQARGREISDCREPHRDRSQAGGDARHRRCQEVRKTSMTKTHHRIADRRPAGA
jgi:zinc protease